MVTGDSRHRGKGVAQDDWVFTDHEEEMECANVVFTFHVRKGIQFVLGRLMEGGLGWQL